VRQIVEPTDRNKDVNTIDARPRSDRGILRYLIAVGALLCFFRAPAVRASDYTPLVVGAAAPAISEPTASGAYDSSKSERPYVLELFAVWCPHCQHEVAPLNQLQQVDGNRVDIIAVPASPFGFDKSSVLQPADLDLFARHFHTQYRIGFDGLFSVAYDYGVASFPTIYFVNSQRRVVAVESGEVPFEKLHADVATMLGHP
jgi:thiol-disulfide isomerase/thioredoxin